MDRDKDEDQYDEEEAARRRDAALLRALSTPHKRQAELKVGKAKRGLGKPSPRPSEPNVKDSR
jgi:hypothetical protein